MKDVQSKVASTILQTPLKVTLGGVSYNVPQPTLGTLIMASSRIAQIPSLSVDAENLLQSVLHSAKDCTTIGEVVAILILGAKEIKAKARKPRFILGGKSEERIIREFGEQISNNTTPKELVSAIMKIFRATDIGDFFELTTFLQGVNLTKPTKVD